MFGPGFESPQCRFRIIELPVSYHVNEKGAGFAGPFSLRTLVTPAFPASPASPQPPEASRRVSPQRGCQAPPS